jgi:hypothetical protein
MRKRANNNVRYGLVLLVFGACASSASRPSTTVGEQRRVKAPADHSLALERTPLRFDLDLTLWHEQPLQLPKNPRRLGARMFLREKASASAECPAGLAVTAELLPADLGLREYAAGRRSQMHQHIVDQIFSHEDGVLQLTSAIGYRARGVDGCHPFVYLVFAKEHERGYMIALDADPEDHPLLEEEIRAILKSFHIVGGDG